LLTPITLINDSGWTRWQPKEDTKSPEPIAAGDYFQLRAWMKPEVKEVFKQQLAPLAANDSNGRFAWLLPQERWVKCVMDGFLPPELTMYGLVEDVPENRALVEGALSLPDGLLSSCREWQRRFVFDYMYCQMKGAQYRRAAIVRVGGGKTLTSLMIAQDHENPLVLAPSYVHDDWRREADKWGLKCPRLSTYESASKHDGLDAIFFDEALLAANPNTRRHGDAGTLARRARTVVGLTGTPQSTSPMDLRWLRVVFPGSVPAEEKPWRYLFGTDTELVEVRPGQKAYVTKTWNQEKVSKFVAPYVMMVDPAEIIKELPEISRHKIMVDIDLKKYQLVLRGAATNRSKSKALSQARMCTDGALTDDNGQILARLSTAKLDAVEQFVGNLGEPVIVAARWDYMVDDLAERLSAYKPAVLKGGADYESEKAKFLSRQTSVLVLNSQISQGMNLQSVCSVLLICSNSMKPTDREQLIGRIYRPGQTRGVRVFDIVARGTLDEKALELLENHKDSAEEYLEAQLALEMERLATNG
jgi:hypothetical protein